MEKSKVMIKSDVLCCSAAGSAHINTSFSVPANANISVSSSVVGSVHINISSSAVAIYQFYSHCQIYSRVPSSICTHYSFWVPLPPQCIV
jgi:hypothetical protein